MPEFAPSFSDTVDDHLFEIVDCRPLAGQDLIDELADELRALYSDHVDMAARLKAQASELDSVSDPEGLEAVIDRVLEASIPKPGTHKVPQLDVARNELAELLAHLLVQTRYGTLVPASRIRHKEIPQAPARGLDLLGLEFEPLLGIVAEVKASEQETSPPDVVGEGDTSLRSQCVAFLEDDDRMIAELNRLYKEAGADARNEIAKAIALQVGGELKVVVSPVLVRPAERAHQDDFGCFRDDPAQFVCERVRFSVISVDRPLEDLAKAVYERASNV
jgi:hypothetical protein